MATFILTLMAFALIMLAMAIGVAVRRPPLKGSCGGMAGACACGANNAGECYATVPNSKTTERAGSSTAKEKP